MPLYYDHDGDGISFIFNEAMKAPKTKIDIYDELVELYEEVKDTTNISDETRWNIQLDILYRLKDYIR